MSFSWSRWVGIIVKEFIQLKRDRLTFGMIIGIPVLQLILFGYAINADPKRLPTAVLAADSGPYARSLVAALQTSGYYRIDHLATNEAELDELLARGSVQFAVTIPENFSRKLVRGERPVLLIEADASDPAATGNAIAALSQIAVSSLARDLRGPLAELAARPPPVDIRVHRRYNPEGVTAYNIVPGLIGTILTMTMVLMTGLAMTRERARGTFENLLSTPAPVLGRLREAVRTAANSAEFRNAMQKVSTPVSYLDAPEFQNYWERDAKRLAAAVEKIGKVEAPTKK